MKDDRFYVVFMLECIGYIREDTAAGRSSLDNRTHRDAVMRNLQLLAESSQRVSVAVKERFPEVPWADLSRFRNVVVHDYPGIDYEIIWAIIANRLPVLEAQLRRLFDELSPK